MGRPRQVPTSVPSSFSEQIAPDTSKIAPETTPGSRLTEVKTFQEKDKVNGTTKTGPTSIPLQVTKQMKPKMFWTVCMHQMQNCSMNSCNGPFHVTVILLPNINASSEVAGISQGTGNNISAPETCQLWAAYDDRDRMPRNYAIVHKVISLNPFKMEVCWLSSKPNKKPLPFPGFLEAFGEFQPEKHETVTSPNYFSHKASFTKQRNGNIRVFPRKGSACALYKSDKTPDTMKFL
ncbi:hypothetical protein CTI12_AA342040 [Artemisia annua]|uniref:DUF3444 domain-containing protein n=1 Tax=Artemisia annua TaxID=35608 RepID=A0A2U1MU16_ARTAN|nr:hypothetical protein CTI12_AA342040 [Artemisia annua]